MTTKCYTCFWIAFWTRKEKDIFGMAGKILAAAEYCIVVSLYAGHVEECFCFGGIYNGLIKDDRTSYLQLVFNGFRKRLI